MGSKSKKYVWVIFSFLLLFAAGGAAEEKEGYICTREFYKIGKFYNVWVHDVTSKGLRISHAGGTAYIQEGDIPDLQKKLIPKAIRELRKLLLSEMRVLDVTQEGCWALYANKETLIEEKTLSSEEKSLVRKKIAEWELEKEKRRAELERVRTEQNSEVEYLLKNIGSMGAQELRKWLRDRDLYGKNFRKFERKYRLAANKKEAAGKILKRLTEWDTKDLKKLIDYCRDKNCDTITRLLRRRTKVPVSPGNIEGILHACYPCAANRDEFITLFKAKHAEAEKEVEQLRKAVKRDISEIFSDSPHLKNLADEPFGAKVKKFKDIPPEIAKRFKDSFHFENPSSEEDGLPPRMVTYFFSGGDMFGGGGIFSGGGGIAAQYYSGGSSGGRACADCGGRGYVEKYIYGRWRQLRCGSCSGSGNAGYFGDYISNGGRQRSMFDQALGRMMGMGGGGGLFGY